MSLNIEGALIEKAQTGRVETGEFLDVVRTSLPDGWRIVHGVIDAKLRTPEQLAQFDPQPGEVTDEEMAQVHRIMASTPIRTALEDTYEIRIGMVNCCKVGAFLPEEIDAFRQFTSMEAQILNQKPGMKNC